MRRCQPVGAAFASAPSRSEALSTSSFVAYWARSGAPEPANRRRLLRIRCMPDAAPFVVLRTKHWRLRHCTGRSRIEALNADVTELHQLKTATTCSPEMPEYPVDWSAADEDDAHGHLHGSRTAAQRGTKQCVGAGLETTHPASCQQRIRAQDAPCAITSPRAAALVMRMIRTHLAAMLAILGIAQQRKQQHERQSIRDCVSMMSTAYAKYQAASILGFAQRPPVLTRSGEHRPCCLGSCSDSILGSDAVADSTNDSLPQWLRAWRGGRSWRANLHVPTTAANLQDTGKQSGLSRELVVISERLLERGLATGRSTALEIESKRRAISSLLQRYPETADSPQGSETSTGCVPSFRMEAGITRSEQDAFDERTSRSGTARRRDDWYVPASARATRTRNPIRELVQGWKRSPNPSRELIDLSIGDPTAYRNLEPPSHLLEYFEGVLRSGRYHGYTHSTGMEDARSAVAEHFNRRLGRKALSSRDIFLTSGVSGALELALAGLLNEGDNILVPCPGFPLLRTIAENLGAFVREYPLLPEQGWKIHLSRLEALVDHRTRALVVNNPSNPCGSVWDAAHITEILAVAARLRLPIVSDEVYADMVFPSVSFHSFAALSREVPIVTVGGLSKQFIVPGWRLGWVVLHDPVGALDRGGYRDGLQRLTTRMLLPNALAQAVVPYALGEEALRKAFLDDLMLHLASNASLFTEKLRAVPGLRCIMPQGAMYMMIQVDCSRFSSIANTMEFCQQLYDAESVLALPGECFGAEGFIRVVTFPPQRIIIEACERIKRFCTSRCEK